MAKTPAALSRVHVPAGIFTSRLAGGREAGGLLPIKAAFEQLGGTFIEHNAPFELLPGVWLLGPVPRVHPERNWSTTGRLQLPAGPVEDNVPEDTAIAVNTRNGLVVISGCGHAGIINTLEYARKAIPRPLKQGAAFPPLRRPLSLGWTAPLKRFVFVISSARTAPESRPCFGCELIGSRPHGGGRGCGIVVPPQGIESRRWRLRIRTSPMVPRIFLSWRLSGVVPLGFTPRLAVWRPVAAPGSAVPSTRRQLEI